jgi:hypothetical protein
MARVRQFANDLGISKNQAQNLINKGRSRKDGGSQILESVMKPKGYLAGGSIASSVKKDSKKIKKTNKKPEDPMGNLFGKDGETKLRPKPQAPYHPKFNPDQYHPKLNPDGKKGRPMMKKKLGGSSDFGMLSVKAGIDKNPKPTIADRIAGAKMKEKPVSRAKGGGMAIQGLGFRGVR